MNSTLQQHFDQIENQRLVLLRSIENLSFEALNDSPAKDKWSIHQILAHIITAEKMTIQYIQKKIQGIEQAGNTGLWEEMKMGILKISQRLPFKFKAPALVVKQTHPYHSLPELIADWNATRESFKALLEKINEDQLRKKIYKHVVMGRLNIVHAVLFFKEHITHHWPQVNRLLK